MINPLDPTHRIRFGRALDHSYRELSRFARIRENTVRAYLGVPKETNDREWNNGAQGYRKSLPKGNLLQLAGLNFQITLAYGEPEFLCVPRLPEHYGTAYKLEPALNRMSKLLDLGETARNIAADSYFGYGIFKVGVGRMPLSAQAATGLREGPCVWRVSQYDFLYDIGSKDWNNIGYAGDIYTIPLNEAQELYPDSADLLATMTVNNRLDAPTVMARPVHFNSAEDEVRLIDVHFPYAGVVATWVIRNDSFDSVAERPLRVREYKGHWSGVYGVLNHLYAPDELIPVAQAESTKSIHFLFNDLMEITSEQARVAKYNPLYQAGSEKDMRRIWETKDRHPVSVVDPNRFGALEIPGPTQSQTAYLATLMQLFQRMTPSMDEPHRAPTATQGELERETTNAVVAEARRKFNRVLQLVGYKLGHLLMNDDNLVLPNSRQLRPGSNVQVDATWYPPSVEPRTAKIDDFDIGIEPYSVRFRSPEERLALLNKMSSQLLVFMQAKAAGSPLDIENVLDTMVKYSGLPELRDWYEENDPMFQAKKQESQQNPPRIGVGQYTRTSVSEKTTAGALEQNLTQAGSENGAAPRFE